MLEVQVVASVVIPKDSIQHSSKETKVVMTAAGRILMVLSDPDQSRDLYSIHFTLPTDPDGTNS